MAADTIAEAKLLAEKITIVTGAARGIGAAIARRFAAAGSLVIAVDLEEPSELVFSIEAQGGQAVPVAPGCNGPWYGGTHHSAARRGVRPL